MRSGSIPGSALAQPLPMLAVVLLFLNDHWFKHSWPGWWTGKLSDVAGLLFFPLFLQALWEHLGPGARSDSASSERARRISVVLTGAIFASIKLWPAATHLYAWGLGALQWPWLALVSGGLTRWQPVAAVTDPTDLLALPVLLFSWPRRSTLPSSASAAGCPASA